VDSWEFHKGRPSSATAPETPPSRCRLPGRADHIPAASRWPGRRCHNHSRPARQGGL